MINWQEIHKFDQLLTLEINSWNCSITDPIWQFFSNIPVWIPMYVLIIALLIWKLGWKKGLIILAGALLTFGFCDQFSNLIKDATQRIRPLNDEFMKAQGLHILEKGGGYSFFSAHSANAFGLACCTFIGFRNCLRARICKQISSSESCEQKTILPTWFKAYTTWMFCWAFMVAVSRIFVGKHYLGDVIVGIIVGSLAGYAFSRLAYLFCRRIR